MNLGEIKSFKKDIHKTRDSKVIDVVLDYDEAEEEVRNYLNKKILKELEQETQMQKKSNEIKDKQYLKTKKNIYRRYITDCLISKNITVRGYEGNKMSKFIEEMVAEFAGYSVLEDAFNDPEVTDIYCIDYKTIFIERNNKTPEKYNKTFRSRKHYENFVKRLVQGVGKEINIGDHKIVDFELYGDRGCAISPAVCPRDYSLSIRKHQEDHITLPEIIGQKLMNETIRDFLGMVIDGECNLIYAGITGSGKTTTLRALLDYFVTRNKKRMLVCEDTQELFPKNEHTVEMVSCKSDDPKLAIPLHKLVFTALRLRPRYIVIGEVRGEEALGAIEAAETGHSTIFTMHGGNPWNIINRLVTKYLMAMPRLNIDVVERIIGASVDFICIQDAIPNVGRKLSLIVEVNYNFKDRRIEMKPIFRYDFYKKNFVFENKISKEKADKMLRRGVPLEELEIWVESGDREKDLADIKAINERMLKEVDGELKDMVNKTLQIKCGTA